MFTLNNFMVIPCYSKVSKEYPVERAVILTNRKYLFKALNLINDTLNAYISELIDNVYVSKVSGGKYAIVITIHVSLRNTLQDILLKLKEEGVIEDFYIIEAIGNILPFWGFLYENEDGYRLRTFTTRGFTGIFINLLNILGDQGEFVVERIGYYLGRSHAEALLKEGVLQDNSVFKAIGYSLLTGVSFGLYRLLEIKVKKKGVLTTSTEVKIRIKDYYEEEEYRKAGINKCAIYQKGFFKGVIEYFISDKNYRVEEPVCYNEKRESLFLIELPIDITKEEREFLNRINYLSIRGKANKP